METREYSPLDRLLEVADGALRALVAAPAAGSPAPGAGLRDQPANAAARARAARLMRVNHAGEIAAQGLYRGQALTARTPMTRALLRRAAAEEGDHLAWCRERIAELGGRRSLLDPVWYAGAVALGALAGLAADRVGLGFIAETERQVEGHLDGHLQRLPVEDQRSRAIVARMRTDEVAHAEAARRAGAEPLPWPARVAMRLAARVMTGTAHWL
ncbi:MAG: 2-polyprenyl-3-methyl-6-methoxy-1,4-benzoquinone monooxygenase [Gammaproteobacteria bacterium]|nr:2-polyprenyl-3-methyl-6-methoxy-1,4-benzoquinone monooxygenase [Gammaproteobacteria bacterium]